MSKLAWLVDEHFDGYTCLRGVFSTKRKAQNFLKFYGKKRGYSETYSGSRWEMIDKTPPLMRGKSVQIACCEIDKKRRDW